MWGTVSIATYFVAFAVSAFDMLMVAPKGKGLSVARVLKCERDEMGQEERLTVRYRTNTWNILEPKAKKERRQLAFSEFLEVNEARRWPMSIDTRKAPTEARGRSIYILFLEKKEPRNLQPMID